MSYSTKKYTLQPGERVEVPGEGRFVRVLEATDWLEIGLDSQPLQFIEQGLALDGTPFRKVVLNNPPEKAAPVTVRLGISTGVIYDSRLSVPSGLSVTVDNFPAEPAPLAPEERPGYVPIGSSFTTLFGGGSNIFHPVVDPAVNVNGVIVRTFTGFENGTTQSNLAVGTSIPDWNQAAQTAFLYMGVSGNESPAFQNIYLPPGYGMWWRQASAGAYCSTTYEVL